MNRKGTIIRVNESTGWGEIRYGKSSFIRFHLISILNKMKIDIKIGQKVNFEIKDFGDYRLALNVFIKNAPLIKNTQNRYTQPEGNKTPIEESKVYNLLKEFEDLRGIIKYNYENWEEVEEIIESKFDSESNSSSVPLDTKNTEFHSKGVDINYVALALFENKIKLVSLTKDGKFRFLDEGQKHHNIIYPSAFEQAALELAIEEFEDLINSPKTSENDFQKFFERNPDFILNDQYKKAHPHIVLSREKEGELITDFVLEPVNQNSFCDLLELKLPSAKTYVMKKNREHFSAAITEAAAQLRVYGQFFNEEKNRNNFQQIYPFLKIYKPRMFLIIGRENTERPMIKREIQSEYPQLIINNFDDLLARMKWKKEKLENKNKLFR